MFACFKFTCGNLSPKAKVLGDRAITGWFRPHGVRASWMGWVSLWKRPPQSSRPSFFHMRLQLVPSLNQTLNLPAPWSSELWEIHFCLSKAELYKPSSLWFCWAARMDYKQPKTLNYICKFHTYVSQLVTDWIIRDGTSCGDIRCPHYDDLQMKDFWSTKDTLGKIHGQMKGRRKYFNSKTTKCCSL